MSKNAESITVTSDTLEKLDEIGANGLNWLQEFSAKGVGFIEEQAPELCNEIVRLGVMTGVFWTIVFGMVVIACLVWWRKGHKYLITDDKLDDMTTDAGTCSLFLLWAAPAIGVIVFGCIAASNLYGALVIWVAPRLYLLEYFTDLVAKVNG